MIVPMYKYGFVVFHSDYQNFLSVLQGLGVLHVIGKEISDSHELIARASLKDRIEETIIFLEKREVEIRDEKGPIDVLKVVEEISEKQELLELLMKEMDTSQKELQKVEPWGDFSKTTILRLKDKGLQIRFYIGNKNRLSQIQEKYQIEIIRENKSQVHFIIIQPGYLRPVVDATEVSVPDRSLRELKNHIRDTELKISAINEKIDLYAASALPLLKAERDTIKSSVEFDQVVLQTRKMLDERLMVLEGWVPENKKQHIDEYLKNSDAFSITTKATPKDNVPVLLQNNRFSKLFEPVGDLFSLPTYAELDLTIFFAPFFMLFFGFCLGDAGYGLLFVIGAGIYKLKASKSIKPYLSLIQYLGVATIILGAISGTFFGINLIESDIHLVDGIRALFLEPANMFNLALIVGGIQIVFGQFVKAANQIRQYGIAYALGTFGWLFTIVSGLIYYGVISLGVAAYNKSILYLILGIGGIFILFFNDPEAGIISRIGQGVWSIYSTVTGMFGDLLSYIRLFALGLSSAILGFVINEIALEILSASAILGPVFFVVFLIIGHTLNILISSLSSFVHPARLTFVEFYKNAGFSGGGKAYNPFSTYSKEEQ